MMLSILENIHLSILLLDIRHVSINFFIQVSINFYIPAKLLEFWPISFIGCMYKILSKILANRLKKVVYKMIAEF